jgi:hypothetical protein
VCMAVQAAVVIMMVQAARQAGGGMGGVLRRPQKSSYGKGFVIHVGRHSFTKPENAKCVWKVIGSGQRVRRAGRAASCGIPGAGGASSALDVLDIAQRKVCEAEEHCSAAQERQAATTVAGTQAGRHQHRQRGQPY